MAQTITILDNGTVSSSFTMGAKDHRGGVILIPTTISGTLILEVCDDDFAWFDLFDNANVVGI
ncbi:MAG: hypothetical protein QQN63_14315, partial [Nitrosopumilus sp.]